ncbi:hypothetical protein [Nocardioides albus]|uniref:Uncharacterized protein n=1 Tax=Nocardioides albus TaxID=1841 RepID=A0A7W5A5G9_9ACTN|nr:hypothetical protein [Nocardioides albus]MBB3089805.1 hypothetical protein [Nocardioides albus]GGU35737.1 hypothetical protein GCM10007979_38470 [Nocardioides albus]
MTRVLMIGIHPRALDYSKLPPGLDEATMSVRIEAGFGATTAAGFDAVNCLIGTSLDEAEGEIRSAFAGDSFGLVMIGAGIRMIPEYTELFERIVNVCSEESPGVAFCFNTSPETTLDALRRHIQL